MKITLMPRGLVLAAALALAGCHFEPGPAVDKAKEQLDQAAVYLELGLTDSALASFGLALEEDARLVQAHLGIGHIYRERQQYDIAARAYERAVVAAPNNFDANYHLALMKQTLGQWQEAARLYLRALAIRPDSQEANQHLASTYLQLNRAADALPYARKAAEMRSDDQGAWANLGATLARLGQYDEALQAYRHASSLKQDELREPIQLGLADAHIHLGQYDRGLAVLAELLKTHPSLTAHERMGYACYKLRRFEESLAAYRAALAIDANDVAALNGVGVALMTLYLQDGRTNPTQRDQALEAWRKSVKIKPDQSRIIDLIARYQRM